MAFFKQRREFQNHLAEDLLEQRTLELKPRLEWIERAEKLNSVIRDPTISKQIEQERQDVIKMIKVMAQNYGLSFIDIFAKIDTELLRNSILDARDKQKKRLQEGLDDELLDLVDEDNLLQVKKKKHGDDDEYEEPIRITRKQFKKMSNEEFKAQTGMDKSEARFGKANRHFSGGQIQERINAAGKESRVQRLVEAIARINQRRKDAEEEKKMMDVEPPRAGAPRVVEERKQRAVEEAKQRFEAAQRELDRLQSATEAREKYLGEKSQKAAGVKEKLEKAKAEREKKNKAAELIQRTMKGYKANKDVKIELHLKNTAQAADQPFPDEEEQKEPLGGPVQEDVGEEYVLKKEDMPVQGQEFQWYKDFIMKDPTKRTYKEALIAEKILDPDDEGVKLASQRNFAGQEKNSEEPNDKQIQESLARINKLLEKTKHPKHIIFNKDDPARMLANIAVNDLSELPWQSINDEINKLTKLKQDGKTVDKLADVIAFKLLQSYRLQYMYKNQEYIDRAYADKQLVERPKITDVKSMKGWIKNRVEPPHKMRDIISKIEAVKKKKE